MIRRRRGRRLIISIAAAALAVTAACSAPADPSESPASDDSTGPPPADSTGPPPADSTSPASEPSQDPTPEPATLPTGGRVIFPDHRLVGFAGGRSAAFGRLGVDDLDGAAAELEGISAAYGADGRTVLPVFELITVIAHASPTASGLYRTVEPDAVIQAYLDAAREHGAVLLLNIQPGRSDFLDEVVGLERWLVQPDIGLALDPEWAVDPGEIPGRVYGRTTGAELDSVAAWLSQLVATHDLPEKVLVFHQVHPSVVEGEDGLTRYPGVAVIKSVDGIGTPTEKVDTWNRLMRTKPPWVHAGFKMFFDEDTRRGPLMSPDEVLALRPLPEYVLYE